MPFKKIQRCTRCKKILTEDEVYFQDNICPYCGLLGKFRASVEEEVVEIDEPVRWWQFWK